MTAEQRARADAAVLAALTSPRTAWEITCEVYRLIPGRIINSADTKPVRASLRRLKRAGKVRFVGTVWEKT